MWTISKQSTTCHWQEEDQLQLRYDNQSAHGNYDSNDQSAENLRVSGNTFPLCFSSFQFLKRNSRQVVNSEDKNFFDESVEDVIDDMGSVLDPKSQSLISLDFQSPNVSPELETRFESVECKSVPLDYNSFQILEESAENFQENANCLPLCFASLLRKHCKKIVNSKKEECSNAAVEENKDDTEADPEVQPLNLFEGQISDEIPKPETGDELIHFDSLPLCFNSFQILRGNLGQILVEDHNVSHEMPAKIPQSSKIFYDPIVDVLDDLCCQSHFPSSSYRLCYRSRKIS
jgi:hypothetical protein